MTSIHIYLGSFALVEILICLKLATADDYTEPLNMGMQMAVPYDLANIFIRPIAGSISVFLSIAMLFILFFGVITSPFGYMFGIPSRKYVLGGTDEEVHPASSRSFTNHPSYDDTWEARQDWNRTTDFFTDERVQNLKNFEVENSLLFLLPQEIDGECNQLLVCYAHGLFRKMPPTVLRFFQFFSRRMLNGNEEVKTAIKTGLGGLKSCDTCFTGCPYSPFKLAVKTFRNLLPNGWRSKLEKMKSNSK